MCLPRDRSDIGHSQRSVGHRRFRVVCPHRRADGPSFQAPLSEVFQWPHAGARRNRPYKERQPVRHRQEKSSAQQSVEAINANAEAYRRFIPTPRSGLIHLPSRAVQFQQLLVPVLARRMSDFRGRSSVKRRNFRPFWQHCEQKAPGLKRLKPITEKRKRKLIATLLSLPCINHRFPRPRATSGSLKANLLVLAEAALM